MTAPCRRQSVDCAIAALLADSGDVGKCALINATTGMDTLNRRSCVAAQTRNSAVTATTIDPKIATCPTGCSLNSSGETKLRYDPAALGPAMAIGASPATSGLPTLCFFDCESRLVAQFHLAADEDLAQAEDRRIGGALPTTNKPQKTGTPLTGQKQTPWRREQPQSIEEIWIPHTCRLDPAAPLNYWKHVDSSFGDGGIARRAAIGTWQTTNRRRVDPGHLESVLKFLADVRMPVTCCVGNAALNQAMCGAVHGVRWNGVTLRLSVGRSSIDIAVGDIDDISVTCVNSPTGPIRTIEVYDWCHHLVVSLRADTSCKHLCGFWANLTNGWSGAATN
ncbi:MAG: hypothetical protein AAGB04_02795 [Pseudomonadota bacterium]